MLRSVSRQLVVGFCPSTEVVTQTTADHAFASASSSTWRVLRALGSALCDHLMFAELAKSFRSPTKPLERERELFPLPTISADSAAQLDGIAGEEVDDI